MTSKIKLLWTPWYSSDFWLFVSLNFSPYYRHVLLSCLALFSMLTKPPTHPFLGVRHEPLRTSAWEANVNICSIKNWIRNGHQHRLIRAGPYSHNINALEDFKPEGYSCEFLVGACCPVLQILTLFQTKKMPFFTHVLFLTWTLKSIPILKPALKEITSSLLRLEQ